MSKITQYIIFLTALLLLGCQSETSIEPAPSVSMSLPLEFSESYQIAFRESPRLTAQRFLQAYDGFAKYGPVTADTVQTHARLHTSLERGQILGGILAVDLNADGLITRVEYESLSGIPNGNKKSIRMAELFEFDENQDDLMTLEEAIRFGQDLNERRRQNSLRPIESYLMLFDLNSDGRVLRDEMVRALEFDLPRIESASHVLPASRSMP